MKWIDSSYEILSQREGIAGMYEQIERVGRLCYKSTGTTYYMLFRKKHDDVIGKIYDLAQENEDDIYVCALGSRIYVSATLQGVRALAGGIDDFKSFEEEHKLTNNRDIDVHIKRGDIINMTAEKFVNTVLKKNGHGAMLEHGTVYLDLPLWRIDILARYLFNKYSRIKFHKGHFLVTTNYRVVWEKDRECDMKYFHETVFHYRRPCVKFVMDRVGSQSVERHRGKYGISFAQESTRFCNYSKDKFGGEITFIIPRWMYKLRDRLAVTLDSFTKVRQDWLGELEGERMVRQLTCEDRSAAAYWDSCQRAEEDYIFLTTTEESEKLNPEDARGVLPLNIKTEFAMTAFEVDWEHFFYLRDDSHAHPDIRYIAHQLRDESVFEDL